jgi:hypothetical protein
MEMPAGRGVIVGHVRDVELPTWDIVEDDDDARAAFGLGPQDSALVVVADGRVEFRALGIVRVYQWGRVSDLLGVEINDRKPAKGE